VDAAVVVARAETSAELHDALIRLPYTHRAVVVLHDAHGFTTAEIAEVFDIGVPAAKQRLRRGRMMLVTALAKGAERRQVTRGVPLSCWEARKNVSDYLNQDVDEGTALALEAHLARCPTCPALYHSLVATRGALAAQSAAGGRDPDSTIPPTVKQLIRTALG
jgi:RNA polymerase sigma-70 factor (ECF subfamily)